MFKLFKNLKKIDYLFLAISIALIVLQVYLELTLPDYTAVIVTELTYQNPSVNVILENGGYMLACAFGSLASAILV